MLLYNSIGEPIKIIPPEIKIASDAAGALSGAWVPAIRGYLPGEHGSTGKEAPYKRVGTDSSRTSNLDIRKRKGY